MAKVKIVTLERSHPLPGAPGIESRAYLDGPGAPLHLARHRLAPGAAMRIEGEPADRLVYVFEGMVAAGDRHLAKGSSLIVEFGARMDLSAGPDGATVLTFNQAERPADGRPGGHVHLLPREAVPRTHDLGTQNEMGGGIHADAACPSCTVWLHENDFHAKAGTTVPPHSHSEDEIIFVTAGEIGLGNRRYGPGTAIAVAADTVYGFEAPQGLSFINFRAASPTVTTSHGVIDEARMWIGKLGKPPYVAADF
jgi:quercetin dioxygenase-like cupin family protein